VSPSRRILAYWLRYRRRYAAGAACLLGASLFSLAIPWTVKGAIDTLAARGADASAAPYALLILALAALNGLARLGSRYAMIGASQWVERDIRRDLYARLTELPPAFYQARLTGDIMSRASSDVTAVRQVVGFGTVMLIGTLLTFAGTTAAMWLIDPRLSSAATWRSARRPSRSSWACSRRRSRRTWPAPRWCAPTPWSRARSTRSGC
jgi:ATP-binding cassette subfamily B protein